MTAVGHQPILILRVLDIEAGKRDDILSEFFGKCKVLGLIAPSDDVQDTRSLDEEAPSRLLND